MQIFGLAISTFDVRGRRSGEAAKGTRKRSLWAVPLDGIVRPWWLHASPPKERETHRRAPLLK
jgi:hypothetical protein